MNLSSSKLQTYIGIGLLVIAILAFFLTILTTLPKAEQVSQVARPLKEIPQNLFSSDNEITQAISKLNVPSNVPVAVDPSTIGRSNVFENY